MGSQEVEIPLLFELFDELLERQRRAGFEPGTKQVDLVAVLIEEIVNDTWRCAVVVDRPEAVFEDHDRPIGAENSSRTTKDSEFCTLDVELDEHRMLVGLDKIVESSRFDIDEFDLFIWSIERTLPDAAVSGVGLDMMELERSGGSFHEGHLANLHRRKVDAEISGQVGERFDSEMADGRSSGHDVLEDVSGVGSDVDGHVVGLHDPPNGSDGQDVVVPVRARLVPEVDQEIMLIRRSAGSGRSSALSDCRTSLVDHALGGVLGRRGRANEMQRRQNAAEGVRGFGCLTHGLGG